MAYGYTSTISGRYGSRYGASTRQGYSYSALSSSVDSDQSDKRSSRRKDNRSWRDSPGTCNRPHIDETRASPNQQRSDVEGNTPYRSFGAGLTLPRSIVPCHIAFENDIRSDRRAEAPSDTQPPRPYTPSRKKPENKDSTRRTALERSRKSLDKARKGMDRKQRSIDANRKSQEEPAGRPSVKSNRSRATSTRSRKSTVPPRVDENMRYDGSKRVRRASRGWNCFG